MFVNWFSYSFNIQQSSILRFVGFGKRINFIEKTLKP